MTDDDRDRAAVLTDRSRRRVFEAISAAATPIGVADLAAACAIHPNTVRLHLDRLEHAGLVQRTEGRPRGPGRPPHRYTVAAADPSAEAAAYRRLAGLLASAVRHGASARVAGRAGAGPAETSHVDDPVRAMVSAMAAEGFRPTIETVGPNTEVVLNACPFADLAANEPGTICQLHLGIAEGMAERVGGVQVEGLVVHDPFEAGCRLVLRRNQVGPVPKRKRRV